ncbi:MAG: ElaA protein [Idiomarinaceae bacterium HL-53]|nr:MAG: ElaA protein [Idiomarinaceae bacterium HL-53]CUS47923.1 ElaA protein [Idiomarinaceae bacterium HL-53]
MSEHNTNWEVKPFSELTAQELYEVFKLRQDVFIVEQTCPYPDIDGTDREWLHVLGWQHNKLAAYARIRCPNDTYSQARIGRVVVAPFARGQQLGRSLMEYCMQYIQQAAPNAVIALGAQTYLLNFYQSLGFISVSETYLEDDIPHQNMEWTP